MTVQDTDSKDAMADSHCRGGTVNIISLHRRVVMFSLSGSTTKVF